MANPFRTFRKYQKSALVGLGVMAMLSFIVFPIIMQLQDASSRHVDVTLATSKYGTINSQFIEHARQEHQLLLQFYSYANQAIRSENPQSQGSGFLQRLEMLGRYSDEAIVYQWLKVQQMKEQGFQVSREMVADYLKMMSDQRINEDIYQSVLDMLRTSPDALIGVLQRDILTQIFDGEYFHSVQGVTPAQEFEWFCRFKRMSKIQAAAIDVASYADEVADPSEKELKEFFEANKNRAQNPNLSESGFAVPRRNTVEYIAMEFDNLDTAAITAEEVQKYYDDNKETLYKIAPANSSTGLGSLPNMPGTGTPFGRAFPNLNLNPGNTAPAAAEPTEFNDLTIPLLPAPETPAVETPAVETPAAAPAEGTSSRNENNATFRLVAYQTETDVPVEAAAPEAISTQELSAVEAPTEVAIPEAAPAAETPAAETPAAETPAPVAEPSTEPASPYRPLSEVEASIRTALARVKAVEKMQKIEGEMKAYYDETIAHTRRQDTAQGKEVAPLKLFDMKKVAAENGLVYKVYEGVDLYKMFGGDYQFSAAYITSAQFSQRTVLDMMFDSSGLVKRYPYRALNPGNGDEYLFWVTASEDQKTPEYADPGIMELVKSRFKEVKAREIAREKTKTLMEEAKKSGKSLQEYFTANPNPHVKAVVETDYFSWYDEPRFTRYEMPQLMIAEVRESGVEIGLAQQQNKAIIAWGNNFMKDVFGLQKGEFGTTINQPENTAYLVNVLEVTPTDDELVAMFEASPLLRMYAKMYASQSQIGGIQESIDEQIKTTTDFKWHETPTAYRERMMNSGQQKQVDGKQ